MMKVTKEVFPYSQSYALLAKSLVSDLLNMSEFITTASKQEVLEAITLMVSELKYLEESAWRISKQASEKSEFCLERLKFIENTLNESRIEQDDIEKQIKTLETSVEKFTSDKVSAETHLKQSALVMEEIQSTINKSRRRAEELEKLWWVPFFGIAPLLVVKGLIASDLERYKKMKKNMDSFKNSVEVSKKSLSNINLTLVQLKSSKSSCEGRVKELEVACKDLQQRRIELKAQVVFFSQIKKFYIKLKQKLESIATDTKDIADIIEYLDEEVTLSEEAELDEVTKIKNAIIQFGEYADTNILVEYISLKTLPDKIGKGLKLHIPCDKKYAVIRWQGIRFWPLSYSDDRIAIALVAIDGSGQKLKQWNIKGGRGVSNIELDSMGEKAIFLCQGNKRIEFCLQKLTDI